MRGVAVVAAGAQRVVMRISSITPMKDEAPFLLEWVAYHRLIGINDILVFSNDCTDGTDVMLERLDEMGELRHFANPSMVNGQTKHHLQVIRYINTSKRLFRSDWVVSLDVDEYICVNSGDGTLNALFEAVGDANVIAMSQHNFGCGGVREFADLPVTQQFVRAASYEKAYHRRLNRRGVKTLTHRSSTPRRIHNHSPTFLANKLDRVTMVNGSGQPLTEVDLTRDVKSLLYPNYGFDLVQLNHYALRSMETFLLKAARGNANHADHAYSIQYWNKYNQGEQHDERIQRWVGRIAQERDRLLQDPELNRLHQRAVVQAQAKIETLKKQPEFAKLLTQVEAAEAKSAAS